jgi:hypothetical protein
LIIMNLGTITLQFLKVSSLASLLDLAALPFMKCFYV